MLLSITRRLAEVAAAGATAGFGFIIFMKLVGGASELGLTRSALPELVHLKLLGTSVPGIFSTAVAAYAHRRSILAVLVAGFILGVRRPVLLRIIGNLFAAVSGAWIAAMLWDITWLLNSTVGLCLVPASVIVSTVFATRLAGYFNALFVLAAGLALGAFAAQAAILQPVVGLIHPLYGFLPPTLLSIPAAWLVSQYLPDSPTGSARRLVTSLGLSAIGVAALSLVSLEAIALRPRPPEPPATRVLDEFAFDVHVQGDPPVLLWTDRERIQVLENPYGDTHRRYALDGGDGMVERIWPSTTGGFYLGTDRKLGWWERVPDGQPIPYQPAAWFPEPDWPFGSSPGGEATFAEDPIKRRLLVFSAFDSYYAVVDRDTDNVITMQLFSSARWPWWYATADDRARVVFISSPVDDGHLYQFDFDSLQITESAPNLYLYETAVDPSAKVLWGARPLTGELLGVDTRSFEIRHRISVEPAVRDLQRDPHTGDLFTCSFLYGDVFRVNPRTHAVSKIGWCGRLCRNLSFDSQRRSLWVATADRICRIPVPDEG